MDRRRFLVISLAGAFAGPRVGEAQPAGKLPTIGSVGRLCGECVSSDIRLRLHDLGYFQGKNISIEPRYAEEATKGAPLVNVSRPHGEIT